MYPHPDDHLAASARRAARLMAEAEVHRALRARHRDRPPHRARARAAAMLRAWAERLEPSGPGRLA